MILQYYSLLPNPKAPLSCRRLPECSFPNTLPLKQRHRLYMLSIGEELFSDYNWLKISQCSRPIDFPTIYCGFASPTCARAFTHCLAVIGFLSVICVRKSAFLSSRQIMILLSLYLLIRSSSGASHQSFHNFSSCHSCFRKEIPPPPRQRA